MKIARLIPFTTLIVLAIYFLTFSGCVKEHSCEGCLAIDVILPSNTSTPVDTTVVPDTAKIDSILNFPLCNACDSTRPLALNSWSFKTNNSYVCGSVDGSLFDTEKYSFDFWGHLQCSKDTGFRIVAFFYPLKFTSDRFNVSATEQSFILQDRINYMSPYAGFILRTDFSTTPTRTIKVVIDTFVNSTKIMVGRFYGYAYTRNNEKSFVDGKFRFIVR
jgi:hypothetical protein